MEILSYLISASVCMALFYLPYGLLLKRLTFFTANRFYLLFVVIASLTIPALHIKITEPAPVQHISKNITPAYTGNIEIEHLHQAAGQQFQLNWMQLAGFVYAMVCLMLLVKMIFSIFKIVRQARQTGILSDNYLVVENENANNSSFFNIIFLKSNNADDSEKDEILTHEKAHVRLWHSADNLFVEITKSFFWFNPFIYLIAKSLKEVHEYEADNSVKHMSGPKKYASLLLRLSAKPAISLTNQFSAYNLKTRITMLFKPRSLAYKKWSYVLVLPVLLITGYRFSIERVYGAAAIKKDFVLVLDAGHGGQDKGALGINGWYEKDLALQLVKQIKAEADRRGIRTILTRSGDETLDFHNRVNNKADAFISIHLNAPGNSDSRLNGMTIIESKYSFPLLSKKLAINIKSSLQQLNGINKEQEIGLNDNPSKGIHILADNKSPAIIVEMGYITNKNDFDYVSDVHNQQLIAQKVIDGVIAYGNSK